MKHRVTMLTPQKAAAWLAKNPTNRHTSASWVKTLAKIIERGEWRLNGEPIIISTEGNLLDGQHRCMAVIESGIPIETLVVFDVDPATFVTLDYGKARTFANVLEAREVSYPKQVAATAREALLWERGSWNSAFVTGATNGELDEALERYPEIYQAAPRADNLGLRGAGIPYLRSGMLTVLLMVSECFDPELSLEFFSGVASGIELPAADPRLTLRRRLFSESSKTSANVPHTVDLRYWWIRAWDAFAAGQELKLLKRVSSKTVWEPRGYEEWVRADVPV